jgi:hypothetical protein
VSNFIKIRSIFLELLHANRRTDIEELRGVILKLSEAKVPGMSQYLLHSSQILKRKYSIREALLVFYTNSTNFIQDYMDRRLGGPQSPAGRRGENF